MSFWVADFLLDKGFTDQMCLVWDGLRRRHDMTLDVTIFSQFLDRRTNRLIPEVVRSIDSENDC